jgi:2-phosphosulfolactate phosphatase
MRVDVAFTPRDLIEDDLGVAVVIDVIRATTSIVTLFSRGLFELYAAPSLGQGEGLARSRGFVLCGEHQGRRPEGFDFGNSPVAFQQQRFDGKSAVLCTTNGTVALHAVHRAHAVLIGTATALRLCTKSC